MDALLTFNPSQSEIDQVVHPLVVHNSAIVGPTQFQPFIISLPDGAGDLVGMIDFDWLLVQFMFVPEPDRRKGRGRALVARAEACARERGLVGMWADTFAFQAPGFFEALGFHTTGIIEDQPRGSRRLIMQKRFDA
jgi:GNAT superfamily N-acetyltransferase